MFRSSIYFELIFFISCKKRVQLHSFAWRHPVFPSPFVGEIILSQLNDLDSFVKDIWPYTQGFISGLSILFHQSICPSFFFLIFIYLFIYGCVGSSFLCEGFLQLRQAGATLHCGAQASHYRGLSCCGAQAPDVQAQQLWLTGLVTSRHVGSSQTRARTCVPCIGRQILNHCATREALFVHLDSSTALFWLLWLCNTFWIQEVWVLQICSSFSKKFLVFGVTWFHINFVFCFFLFLQKMPLGFWQYTYFYAHQVYGSCGYPSPVGSWFGLRRHRGWNQSSYITFSRSFKWLLPSKKSSWKNKSQRKRSFCIVNICLTSLFIHRVYTQYFKNKIIWPDSPQRKRIRVC